MIDTRACTLALLVCGACLSAGCDWAGDSDADSGASCNIAGEPAAQLGGTWSIEGSGSRTDCDQPGYDSESFELGVAGLDVRQSGADLWLASDPSPSGGSFSLSGRVDGACVTFETTERWEGKLRRYSFRGRLSAGGWTNTKVRGSFTGSGSDGCEVDGSFSLSYR